jgi:hypothetical protein
MPPGDDDDLRRRAFAAYFKAGATDQPSNQSGVEVVGGLKYVHLRSAGRTLAVYRVENVGRLKRLRRWPKELDGLA